MVLTIHDQYRYYFLANCAHLWMFYTFFSLIFLSSTSCRAGLLVIITIVLHPVVCLFICTVHCKLSVKRSKLRYRERKTENSLTQIEIQRTENRKLWNSNWDRERKTENSGTQIEIQGTENRKLWHSNGARGG